MCEAGLFDRVRRIACISLLFSGLTALMQLQAFAIGSVTLTWDATADTSVSGYIVYYGLASGSYPQTHNVGNVTNTTITNLIEGTTYYFAVTAHDVNGLESVPSNEVFHNVTNPFIGAAGNYYGLFNDPDGVAHQSAGYITFTTTRNQNFSGSLRIEGEKVVFLGKFDLAGMGTLTKPVYRRGMTNLPIAIKLVIDLAGGKMITGTVSNAGWSADIVADLAPKPATTNLAGQYTMVLPGSADAGVEPGGDGSAVIKARVGTIGLMPNVSGYLGDGEMLVPVKVPLSQAGRWPFYVRLYKYYRTATNPPTPIGIPKPLAYRGSVLGWLTITNGTVEGDLVWNKTGWTNGFYNAGFSNEITVLGSPYTPPAVFQKVIALGSNSVARLKGGNLSGPITNKFDWILAPRGTNQLVFPKAGSTNNPNSIALTVRASDGWISGTFVPNTNAPTVKAKIYGAVLQNQNYAGGFFKGTNLTGSIQLQEN